MKRMKIVGVMAILLASVVDEFAQADRPRVSVGVSFGIGTRPSYPRYYGSRYYSRRPYCGPRRVYVAPVVVRPRPLVDVANHPVYVQQRPVIIERQPVVVEREPLVYTPNSTQPVGSQSPSYSTQPTQPAATQWTASAPPVQTEIPAISIFLQQLSAPDAKVRSAAALELGRRKVQRAVDPLTATLAGDVDPTVREAAARALGLIGSRSALTALTNAAQADEDRDVRRSAQFSSEIILANLRK